MSYNGGRRIYVDADGYEHMDIDHDEPTNRITNADKIRAMTNEELAMWINDVTTNAFSVLSLGSNKQTKTIFHWLDWLKQEAKE